MPKNCDVLCAGGCGKYIWRGRGSLAQPMCQDCRRRKRQRTCEACEKQYDPGRHGKSKYCSKECARIRNTKLGTCRLCGASFVILARDRLIFCSRKCSDEWLTLDRLTRPKVKPPSRPPISCRVRFPACKFCGVVFCAHVGRSYTYCSDGCMAKAAKRRDALRADRKLKGPFSISKVCTECQTTFEARSSLAKYCSNRCRKRGRGDGHQSRARHFGVVRESFGVTEIYERDGWTCGICGDPVDADCKWPERMCPSLDHIVPLSAGGSHTRDNVRCAHWLCNTLRGVTDINFMVA